MALTHTANHFTPPSPSKLQTPDGMVYPRHGLRRSAGQTIEHCSATELWNRAFDLCVVFANCPGKLRVSGTTCLFFLIATQNATEGGITGGAQKGPGKRGTPHGFGPVVVAVITKPFFVYFWGCCGRCSTHMPPILLHVDTGHPYRLSSPSKLDFRC